MLQHEGAPPAHLLPSSFAMRNVSAGQSKPRRERCEVHLPCSRVRLDAVQELFLFALRNEVWDVPNVRRCSPELAPDSITPYITV
eukprot:173113-Rhodomonas_salina.1